MNTQDLPAREAMEFDVVIVGAGPAGLAAAIRLKQLSSDINVVVVEKGSEVGAHILSGAVIDPAGLDRLLPEWRSEDTPIKTGVSDDRFYWLSASRAVRLPNFLMPPLMSNHGNYVVSLGNVCRWLATKAEASGIEIYPGFAAVELLFDGNGAVAGVATGDMGVAKDGHHKDSFTRGMELRAKYTLFAEGARGSLSKILLQRFALDDGREPQKFGIGLKELWQVAPDRHRPGLVQHSFGWPLDNGTGGGSFLYHLDEQLVSVGFVVHLNYENPYLSPFDEFQRFKTHPLVRGTFEGGKRLAYGARALTEGGWQSVPEARLSRRRAHRLRRRIHERAAHQRQPQRDIVGGARRRACRRRARGWSRQRRACRLRRSLAKLRDRPRSLEGAQRQAAMVAVRDHPGNCSRRLRYVDQYAWVLAIRHAAPRQARLGNAQTGGGMPADRLSQARRESHLRPSLIGIPVQHESRGGPAGRISKSPIPAFRRAPSTMSMAALRRVIARPVCTNGLRRRAQPRFVINAQNCVHCKTCDIKDPNRNITWVRPEGGGGPNYPNM